MLKGVAVCCSVYGWPSSSGCIVLQYVTGCCRLLQDIAGCSRVLQCVCVSGLVLGGCIYVEVCCRAWQYFAGSAVFCRVLQCVTC